MTSSSLFDTEGTARLTLREIVQDYGTAALDDERLITSLLADLLAGHPREATLIRAAARVRAAALLRSLAANRIPVGTAIEDVGARLGHEALIELNAARWIVTEYAIALDMLGPGGVPAQPGPPLPEAAPTSIDSPPPAPVTGRAAAVVAPVPTSVAETAPGGPVPAPAPPAARPGIAGWPLTAVAAALPVLLAVATGFAVSDNVYTETYFGRLQSQWLSVAFPMTITLIVVTALTRSNARRWGLTAAYVLGVWGAATVLPWAAENPDAPLAGLARFLRLDIFEYTLHYSSGNPVYWMVAYAVALAVLTHAVMKRLGTVTRFGLLTAIGAALVSVAANARTYYVVVANVRESYYGNVDLLVAELVAMNIACAVIILLSRVPRIAGRR